MFATLVLAICTGLIVLATLIPAPPVVLPFVVLIGIGGPMVAAIELSLAVDSLRRAGSVPESMSFADDEDSLAGALEELLDELDGLPETSHPLGL